MRVEVCPLEDLPPGSMKAHTTGRVPLVVVRTPNGSLHAIFGRCPHQKGPLTLGRITGTNLPSECGQYRYAREGEVLRCPWHSFEFDVTDGRCLADPERLRVHTYPVSVDGGKVVVEV